MTLIKPLFIIKTGIHYKSSIDLMNQILYNKGSVYVNLYHHTNLHDMYYKYLGLFKNTSYNKFMDRIFYDTYQSLDIDTTNILYTDNRFKDFSHFIHLDCSNIYYPKFFQYIYDLNDDIDLYTIKPYQTIDLNLRIDTNATKIIKIINKKLLEFLFLNKRTDTSNLPQPFKAEEIRNNNFISTENKNISKYNVQESKFKLLYLVEETGSILKDSYCFFYNENSKCMNIDNNIVGHFTVIDNDQIMVNWSHNGSIYVHKYIIAENNNYYRFIDVDQTI
jgi:hypothetical protein